MYMYMYCMNYHGPNVHVFSCFFLLPAASLNERVMGEHLRTWSETEYTNAGEVMQNVGKTQEEDAKRRFVLRERERERERKT